MGQELYLVGSGLIEGLEKTLGVEIQRHFEFEGKIFLLTGFNYTLQKLLTVMFIIYCVCKIPSVWTSLPSDSVLNYNLFEEHNKGETN